MKFISYNMNMKWEMQESCEGEVILEYGDLNAAPFPLTPTLSHLLLLSKTTSTSMYG